MKKTKMLSDEDRAIYKILSEVASQEHQLNKSKELDILSFCKRIKDEYDVEMLDGIPKEAFSAYLLLMTLFCLKTEPEKEDKHTDSFLKYLEQMLQKAQQFQKSDPTNKNLVGLRVSILIPLYQLYKKTKNKSGYIQSFYQYYKIIIGQDSAHIRYEKAPDFNALSDYFFNDFAELNSIVDQSKKIFIGNEKHMASYIRVLLCADDPQPILITGETGTGKEMVAKMIHQHSYRRNNNFRSINGVAVPETLFDSSISGILKGAASSVSTRLGVFLSACGNRDEGYHVKKNTITFKLNGDNNSNKQPKISDLKKVGGTVFFDEINSLPIHLQTKLLRIIQENEVTVVGEEAPRQFNAKFVSASNSNIQTEIRRGNFREDLYYRISAQEINLPALRDMRSRIVEFAQHKIDENRKIIDYKPKLSLSSGAQKKLQYYDWPGNVRELNNVIYRAICELRLEGRKEIKKEDIILPPYETDISAEIKHFLSNTKFEDLEKKYTIAMLTKTGGNISAAAENAGFGASPTRFRTLMKNHKIDKNRFSIK